MVEKLLYEGSIGFEEENMATVVDLDDARNGVSNPPPHEQPILKFSIPQEHSLTVRARAFIFSDPRSKLLLPVIDRIAPSDANVLVTGETGTGKELVARYVHGRSKRANRPFLAINCGAFSETLIESELFGHEKGAFTGALASREGWFEAANGGTLFLDEIGDLPMALQVKLLRVLQENEVVRLGSRKPISLDVRLIAATNVDLAQAVSAGRFREDLYYRLQVITLPLLPLRERRADILPLARHFLDIYGQRLGTGAPNLSPDAEEALFSHSWPGNIRELENVIHRATLVSRNLLIQPADLTLPTSPSIGRHQPEPARSDDMAPATSSPADLDAIRPILARLFSAGEPDILDRLLDVVVNEAYNYSQGNQVRTASVLGVTRNVVRTYLKRAGLIANSDD
jgi:DNA-binding NtrC family response regulator